MREEEEKEEDGGEKKKRKKRNEKNISIEIFRMIFRVFLSIYLLKKCWESYVWFSLSFAMFIFYMYIYPSFAFLKIFWKLALFRSRKKMQIHKGLWNSTDLNHNSHSVESPPLACAQFQSFILCADHRHSLSMLWATLDCV